DAPSGALTVTVVDAATLRPIGNTEITLEARDGQTRTRQSDERGEATFDALRSGLYRVVARADAARVASEPSVQVVAPRTTVLRVELQPPKSAATIEEVQVTARALQADRFGSVTSAYLNRDELRNAVGAGGDVMRALDGVPGLASTGDFASFSVRGRGPRNNLVFVDGFPFDKVVHFDQSLGEEQGIEGGGRYSIFAPDTIAGAEFSPGGWSAAYGGRSGSLLDLSIAGGTPSPRARFRLDLAGYEGLYEGPSGLRDDTTVLFTARTLDFGQFFESIDELDIGQPENQDVILKTTTSLTPDDELEFLAIAAPEKYTRTVRNVLASPDFEDTSLLNVEQDLYLFGATWRRLVGTQSVWTNQLYVRDSDKTSSEGEAFPDLVPPGAPAASVPRDDRLITLREAEREFGWRSDFTSKNRFGPFAAGLRATSTDIDFSTEL
ncbi:MAG: carboxypeptidase regulatory-like domain-containing protein, partial [Pseudomonadota bacterium]